MRGVWIENDVWILHVAGSGLLPRAELSAPWHQVLQHPDEQQRPSQVGRLWVGQVVKNKYSRLECWCVAHVATSFRLYNAEDKERPYTNKVITLWYRWVNIWRDKILMLMLSHQKILIRKWKWPICVKATGAVAGWGALWACHRCVELWLHPWGALWEETPLSGAIVVPRLCACF